MPGNKNHFISPKTGKISMVQVEDPLAGEVIQANTKVLKPASAGLIFGQLILVAAWILLIISSIIFGIVWSIRYWMGKISGGSNIWVRLWPLITSLLFIMIAIAFIIGFANPIELLGKAGFISISLLIFTICFALVSAWSVFYIIRERQASMNKVIYWHSAILACLHSIVTCYLMWYGVIGIQTWSY